MDSAKAIAIFLIILALFGFYLESQYKFVPFAQALGTPTANAQTVNPGMFVLALVAFVVVLSFVPEGAGTWLTVVVVLGALLVDNRLHGNGDMLHTLFFPGGNNPLSANIPSYLSSSPSSLPGSFTTPTGSVTQP